MEDEKIVAMYWDRDEQAIAESKKKYGSYCRTVAHNILFDPEDEEECINDTWLRAWNTIPPKKPALLSVFFGKITRNLAFDVYKKKHGLLTTQEIINIRKKRGWSQEKMAKFLDIGLKDIARYENGAVQTKAIDNMIRLVDNDQIFYAMAKYLNKLSFAE